LKGLEQRYRNENADIQRRNDDEGRKNYEMNNQIKDLEGQIRQSEERIMIQRKELDGARYSNSALTDSNGAL
jgi:peptidoglycan hydrolase CwlO-like protein